MARSRLLLLALLLVAGTAPLCGDDGTSPFRVGLPDGDGLVPVEVALTGPAASARVLLDGADVTASFAAGGDGLVGSLPVQAPGSHRLAVTQPSANGITNVTYFGSFDSPEAAPGFLASTPAPGASGAVRSAWLRLRFAGPVPREALDGWGFGVECDGRRLPRSAVRVAARDFEGGAPDSVVIVNPSQDLAPGGDCRVAWQGADGPGELAFRISETPSEAALPYDRTDPFQLPPFPDDYWLVEEDGARSVELEVAPYERFPLNAAANGIAASVNAFDGFSPVQPIVIQLPGAVSGALLPADELASLDPFARIALFDVDPGSPGFGERIPFTSRSRSDLFVRDGTSDFSLVLFPAQVLREDGRYAVVVTRRLHLAAAQPLGPSPFFAAVAGGPSLGEPPEVARARASIEPVLDFLESVPAVPIPREDVALAFAFTIRSRANDPLDWIAVAEDHLAGPPIPLRIETASPGVGGSTVFRGTIELPSYLAASLHVLSRDPATGRPVATGTEAVPFVLQLPPESANGAVPLVIYSHGSPGSPEEITGFSQEFLRDAGYAMIGIQDVNNRRFGETTGDQIANILGVIIAQQALPLGQKQTHFDTIGLLRAIEWLGSQSLLPLGAPDAVPEVDPSRLLFRGISFGAHHSLGFLPFMPEVTAGVGVVGGGRDYEDTLHQVDFFGTLFDIQALVPDANPALILAAFAILQNDADRYDPHLLARYLYREPLAVPGQTDTTPPSVLWLEGVGDSIVSNTATRSAARELGIPQVGNVAAPTPVLSRADAPLSDNIGPGVTGGHYQYDPPATPSCVLFGETEGHFCPQIAREAEQQILHFFATALEGSAEILDPLPAP